MHNGLYQLQVFIGDKPGLLMVHANNENVLIGGDNFLKFKGKKDLKNNELFGTLSLKPAVNSSGISDNGNWHEIQVSGPYSDKVASLNGLFSGRIVRLQLNYISIE